MEEEQKEKKEEEEEENGVEEEEDEIRWSIWEAKKCCIGRDALFMYEKCL